MKFPWAKQNHTHQEFIDIMLRYSACSGCGHVILMGHVDNKLVRVFNRQEGWESTKVYGKSCAPAWDMEEIGIDGVVRYYKDNKQIKE